MLKGNHNSTPKFPSNMWIAISSFLPSYSFTFLSDSSSLNKTNGKERNLEMEMVDGSKSAKAVVAQAEVGISSFCRHMESK